jgi:hypothetical protein
MNVRDQPYIRQLVANNIQKLINKQQTKKESRQTHKEKIEAREHRLIKDIKKKIEQNQLIVTKADKGNSLVILHKEDYNNKVEEFITNNSYTELPHGTANKLQRSIKNSLNKCNNIIHKNNY